MALALDHRKPGVKPSVVSGAEVLLPEPAQPVDCCSSMTRPRRQSPPCRDPLLACTAGAGVGWGSLPFAVNSTLKRTWCAASCSASTRSEEIQKLKRRSTPPQPSPCLRQREGAHCCTPHWLRAVPRPPYDAATCSLPCTEGAGEGWGGVLCAGRLNLQAILVCCF